MITLGMDCATDTVGLALLNGETILAEIDIGSGKNHAEVLLPALEDLLERTGISMADIDLLACTCGPGSFTGVRTGASTAKGIAMALGKPIVGVSTLEALAMNALPRRGIVCTLLDARRGQIYAGSYGTGADGFSENRTPDRLIDFERWIADPPKSEFECIGDGAIRYRDRILECPNGRCLPAWDRRHRIHAGNVGLLGVRDYSRGRCADALTFMPRYLRLSEAEARIVSTGRGGQL